MRSTPNSRTNLDRAIQRYAVYDVRAVSLLVSMANAIFAFGIPRRTDSLAGKRTNPDKCYLIDNWLIAAFKPKNDEERESEDGIRICQAWKWLLADGK